MCPSSDAIATHAVLPPAAMPSATELLEPPSRLMKKASCPLAGRLALGRFFWGWMWLYGLKWKTLVAGSSFLYLPEKAAAEWYVNLRGVAEDMSWDRSV